MYVEGEYGIKIDDIHCTVDSGTSLFYLPEDQFKELGEQIIKDNPDCQLYDSDLYACETTDMSIFKPIYFEISKNTAVEVLPENYVLKNGEFLIVGMSVID